MPKFSVVALISLIISLAPPSAFAQNSSGGYPTTNNLPLPGGAVPLIYAPPPILLGLGPVRTTPAPTLTFEGLGDNDTFIPPMPNGAVGPHHVMTMLTSQVRITDRTGATVYSTVSTLSWWSALISGVLGTSDVRTLYDPYSDRWIAVSDVDTLSYYNYTNTPYVFIAVSQTSDPTGGWYGTKIAADPGGTNYADYTMVGFNKDKIVVTFNSYAKSSGNPFGVGFLIFNKTNLYGGMMTNYQFIYKPWQTYGFSISPVVTYDPTETNMWMISTWNAASSGFGYLAIFNVQGSIGSCSISQSQFFPRTSAWTNEPTAGGYANFAPQLGASELIYTFDDRIMQSTWRNGSIWCAQTIYLPATNPSRCSVQWWQIDPLNGLLQQIGRIDDSTGVTNYAYPSLAVNTFNDVLIGYSRFSSNQYASANYTFHAYNDPVSVTDGDYVFRAGVSPYWKTSSNTNDLRNRWGDFTRATVDPVNDVDFWTVQEYAAQMSGSNVVNGSGQWAVEWANLQMTPTNNMFTNAIIISGFDGVSNVSNVRATTEPGEPTNIDGKVGGASVWYAWTAPGTGYTLLETYATDFPTLIGVYTGSTVTNLTNVATAAFLNDPATDDFKTSFTASEGTTYYIAIDGVNGAIGTTTFEWEQDSAPQFMLQPQPTNILAGSNVTFTALAAPAIISYQWKFDGTNIAGATNSAYTMASFSTNQTGNYSVNATNSLGWTNSTAAWLQVYPTATPVLSDYSISNNQLSFTVSGITNSIYLVQASTNLAVQASWVNVYTGAVTYIYLDRSGVTNTNYLQRYYRALWAP